MLTAAQWIQVGHMAITSSLVIALFLFRTGRGIGEKASHLSTKLTEIEHRLEDGNKRMSKLFSQIQGLPGVTTVMRRELDIVLSDHGKLMEMVGDMRERLARIEARQRRG